MLEREIEAYLVKRCKALGILCDKFVSPNQRNVPDRVLSTKGRVLFLELKATGKKPTEAQQRDHQRRMDVGTTAMWTDSKEGIDTVLRCLGEKIGRAHV